MSRCAKSFRSWGGKKLIEKDGKVIRYADGSTVTWKHVLCHTSGMGWTRPKTRPSLPGIDRGSDVIFILPFAADVNEHIIYSDLPVILMGKAMEMAEGRPLDWIVQERLLTPLQLNHTGYRRISQYSSGSDFSGRYFSKDAVAPTEHDTAFRRKRIWGEVHDENAWLMDGVSAHAGIFSTAKDVYSLMRAFADAREHGGILKLETAREMSSLQAEENGDRRALIWQMSGRGEHAYTRLLSDVAYGHAGFTGCFVWNDPIRKISIVFLSNDIYNGRDHRVLAAYRPAIMKAILDDLGM